MLRQPAPSPPDNDTAQASNGEQAKGRWFRDGGGVVDAQDAGGVETGGVPRQTTAQSWQEDVVEHAGQGIEIEQVKAVARHRCEAAQQRNLQITAGDRPVAVDIQEVVSPVP